MIIKKILLASLTYSQIWLIPRWTIAYEAMSQNHSPFTRQKNMLFFKSLHSSFVKQSQVVFAN
jgi:hypothetical protein